MKNLDKEDIQEIVMIFIDKYLYNINYSRREITNITLRFLRKLEKSNEDKLTILENIHTFITEENTNKLIELLRDKNISDEEIKKIIYVCPEIIMHIDSLEDIHLMKKGDKLRGIVLLENNKKEWVSYSIDNTDIINSFDFKINEMFKTLERSDYQEEYNYKVEELSLEDKIKLLSSYQSKKSFYLEQIVEEKEKVPPYSKK